MNIYCDLHTHSISSGHAYSTIEENIRYSKEIGLNVYGITDHAPSLMGAPNIWHFRNIYNIPKVWHGVRVLVGAEANILQDGDIDLDEKTIKVLDYIIASYHRGCGTDNEGLEINTDRYIKVMKNCDKVKIIGHPDDTNFPNDIARLMLACKEYEVLPEVNLKSLIGFPASGRIDGKRYYTNMLKFCKDNNIPIIIGSDAHVCTNIANFTLIENLLKETEFPEELVVNYNILLLNKYFPCIENY